MAEQRFYVGGAGSGDAITTAFYRFLDVHGHTAVGSDGACGIRSEFEGPRELKVLSFWSDRAAAEFVQFWDHYSRVYCARRDS